MKNLIIDVVEIVASIVSLVLLYNLTQLSIYNISETYSGILGGAIVILYYLALIILSAFLIIMCMAFIGRLMIGGVDKKEI